MILLSGVHGVGKGYFIDNVLTKIFMGRICTASELIEKYAPATDAGYKRVSDVAYNQNVLIQAIKNELADSKERLLLDGHMCIINSKDDVERIPISFFNETDVDYIILIQDDSSKIIERLNKRDGKTIPLALIEKVQLEEREYAQYLLEEFDIEYKILNPDCNEEDLHNIRERLR